MFWQEAAQSVRGAWRLALLDPNGMAAFNLSLDGFWRSFLVYLYLAPVYLLLVLSAGNFPTVSTETVLLAKLVSYAARIVGSTLLMALLCYLLNAGERFVALIVACNWATVLQLALMLVVTILVTRLPLGRAGDLLQASATIAILFYAWFITRTALGVGVLAAIGVIAADTLLSELIGLGLDRLFGLVPLVVNR